jgi:AraC family transcriptional activator of tynA and feaB
VTRGGSAAPCVIPVGSGTAQLARDTILRLTEKGADWGTADCAAMMDALISLLDASLKSEVRTGPVTAPHLVGIKAEMQARLADTRLSPVETARAAGISVRSLYRLFAREQQTFSQVLLDLRLAYARSLIERNTPHSLTTVAMNSGFGDSAHFSRAYRARFGEAPRQTRERLRAQ